MPDPDMQPTLLAPNALASWSTFSAAAAQCGVLVWIVLVQMPAERRVFHEELKAQRAHDAQQTAAVVRALDALTAESRVRRERDKP